MNGTVLTTIAVTGFTVAFFHAAIPTLWLPFVLTARVRKWDRSKTLLITTLAGIEKDESGLPLKIRKRRDGRPVMRVGLLIMLVDH